MDFNFSSGMGGLTGNRDHYSKVENITPQGFFQRMKRAIGGVVIGFLLFFSAFPLLRWGENRQNLAEFVEKAKTVTADSMPAETGLIKVSGLITSTESVNDPDLLNPLTGKKILRLERSVQMYAWTEKKRTEEQGNQKITHFDYSTEWTGSPANSSGFDTQQGHFNPPLTLENKTSQVSSALVGKLPFEASRADFYEAADFKIEDSYLNKASGKSLTTDGKYVYLAYGVSAPTMNYADPYGINPQPAPIAQRNPSNNPQVGDVRVSYRAFADAQNGTVAGDWNGTMITPHVYDKTATFLGVYPGSAEAFAAHLEFLHKAGTWGIRIATFFMMWIGLGLIIGPLTTLVESIPIIGGAGKSVIGLFTGALAFIFWCVALILAQTWILILLCLLVVGAVGWVVMKAKNRSPVQNPIG